MMMNPRAVCGCVLKSIKRAVCLFVFHTQIVYDQTIRVGPNGEASAQTLRLPYAFYNETFGLAAGFVHGKVGSFQKQAALLAAVMVGSKGSALGFLMGRDLQMYWVVRLFLDHVIQFDYFKYNES